MNHRSQFAVYSGSVLAAAIASLFLGVYALAAYQIDNWDTYVFRGTLNLADACRYHLGSGPTTEFSGMPTLTNMRPVSVPHKALPAPKGTPNGPYYHLYYRCYIDLSSLSQGDAISYVHTGWIGGEQVTVKIDGVVQAVFAGPDKPSFILDSEKIQRERSLTLEILTVGRNLAQLGLVGGAPMVLAQGTAANFRIFGLETLLQQVRPLYQILPLLTLGMILVLGWLLGNKSRLVVVTFLFLIFAAGENLVSQISDVLPVPILRVLALKYAFSTAAILTFVLYGMELFGIHRRHINRFQLGIVLLFVVQFTFLLLSSDTKGGWAKEMRSFLAITSLSYFLIRAYGEIRGAAPETRYDRARLTINKVFAVFSVLILALYCVETIQHLLFDSFQMIRHYANLLMPLFVGGVLLYSMRLVEDRLNEEREVRAKMENDLALAAKLQGVLLPKELKGEAQGMHYEVESVPFGILGGDWVKIHASEGRALFVLGDVVGKGPSAALTHSGIAAAWESQIKLWQRGLVSSEELLMEINKTMFDLFGGAMNTTFAAAEVVGESVRVASGGNYWLLLNPSRSRPVGAQARALLGVKSELKIQFQEIDVAEGDWLVCFTDGVLEGNRPVKRFIRSIQDKIDDLDGEEIRKRLAEAGAGEVHPDDASSLILRFKRKSSGDGVTKVAS